MNFQIKEWLIKNLKLVIILLTIVIHIGFLLFYKINLKEKAPDIKEEAYSFTNIIEFVPTEKEKKNDNIIELPKQEKTTEEVITTEKEIKETEEEYLPQYQITEPPVIPEHIIKERIIYPPLANKQGIEGVVYLELYIDKNGVIRKIEILKDPGYGFGLAAKKALEDLRCVPAKINGIPVAVKYRYAIRFVLRK